jgi:hypothetical protein
MNFRVLTCSVSWGVGGMAQVIEHLPSNCEALNSNPQYHQKKKNEEKVVLG